MDELLYAVRLFAFACMAVGLLTVGIWIDALVRANRTRRRIEQSRVRLRSLSQRAPHPHIRIDPGTGL